MKKSFDVFDTLITRLVPRPEDIFYLIERKYKISGFMNARLASEIKLRTSSTSEPNIFAIYMELAKINKNFGVINEELEIEYKLSTPIRENINKLAGNSCFISDMYLPAKFIKKLLEKHCEFYVVPGKNLFVSSEFDSTKRTGSLFKVAEQINGPISHHIGDHPVSDYEIPRLQGISAEIFKEKIPKSILSVIKENKKDIDYFTCGVVRAMLLEQRKNPDSSVINTYLVHVIPLLFYFSRWLIKSAKSRGIKNIYFLSRDGFLPYIISRIISDNNINIKYLKLSRAALSQEKSIKEYLLSEGIEMGMDIAIVDAGWHGSIQKRINELYNNSLNIHGFYLGILDDNCLKKSDYSAYLFSPENKRNAFVAKYIPIIEFLLSAPHGSVAEIKEDQHGQFIIKYLKNERFEYDLVYKIVLLAENFSKKMLDVLSYINNDNSNEQNEIQTVIRNFRELLACPSGEFSRGVKHFHHFENSPNDSSPIIAKSFRLQHLFGLNKTWWPEGTLALSPIGRIKNKIAFRTRLAKEKFINR